MRIVGRTAGDAVPAHIHSVHYRIRLVGVEIVVEDGPHRLVRPKATDHNVAEEVTIPLSGCVFPGVGVVDFSKVHYVE